MGSIKVSGIKLYAYHGCMPEEEIIGRWYEVDVEAQVDTSAAEKSDKLSDTVNYAIIVDIVRREMNVRSKLVEHVVRRIIDSLLKEFLLIEEVKVKVSKLNPPVKGEVDRFSVELKQKR
jgi:dihydroneopterin aldolase